MISIKLSYDIFLSSPPIIKIIFSFTELRAFNVESAFVDFESLMNFTPLYVQISSTLCCKILRLENDSIILVIEKLSFLKIGMHAHKFNASCLPEMAYFHLQKLSYYLY